MTRPASLLALTAVLLTACSSDRGGAAPEMSAMESPQAARASMVSADSANDFFVASLQAPAEPAPAGASLDAAAVSARKLIRTGTIQIRVEDAPAAAERIEDLAASRGGYVSDASGGASAATLTLRVPQAEFASTLRALRSLGEVEHETVATQDVGREYADLEARLRTKREVAERMRQILATKTASLQDLFEAERQLTSVLEEIERMEGQRRYFDSQVALSSITATVQEPQAHVTTPIASLPPFLDPARGALVTAREHLSVLLGVVTYVVAVAAPWLVLIGLIALVGIAVRRRLRPAPVG
jgi:hypothetical protein